MRALTDSAAGIIGSIVVICHLQTASPSAFGGAFQRDDTGACRSANPNTGSCSCTSGFAEQAQRVIVDGPLGAHLFTCVPPLAPVQICPGVTADPSGAVNASGAIQQCLAGNAEVELPVGTYRVDQQVTINTTRTLRTLGTAGSGARCLEGTRCAALTASSSFYQQNGFVSVCSDLSVCTGVSDVVLDHIILDGNRGGRVNSSAWQACASGSNRYGFNARYYRCTNCAFNNSASINAVCGTGLEWFGDYATVSNSIFAGNGDQGIWADGLTILRSDNATVTNNAFRENTDIGFIFGGGNYSSVAYNTVENRSLFAFAGLMMDNFNTASIEGRPMGHFYGTTFYGNWVECDRCSFAMNVGPYAWYSDGGPIYGGTLSNNVFRGGHISLNVDGSGADPNSGVAVLQNTVGPNIDQGITCMQTALFNLSYTDSFLHPSSTMQPTSYQNTYLCHR